LSSGAELVPNADWNGQYFGASIRSGPFKLNKQEDRIATHERIDGR